MTILILENTLIDQANRRIAQFADGTDQDQMAAYQNAFSTAQELLTRVQLIVEGFCSPQALPSLRVGRQCAPDAGTRLAAMPPSWLPRAVETIDRALGGQSARYKSPMLITELSPLRIDGNSLLDNMWNTVVNISDALPEKEAQNYLHLFAASVDLLDIVDYISFREVDELRKNYEDAREFNKHEHLPSEVSILGVSAPIMPDELEADRRLVAKAKGKPYLE